MSADSKMMFQTDETVHFNLPTQSDNLHLFVLVLRFIHAENRRHRA